MALQYGVKRGPVVTSFGANIDAAANFWAGWLGSCMVYKAQGRWGATKPDGAKLKRWRRWLRLKEPVDTP